MSSSTGSLVALLTALLRAGGLAWTAPVMLARPTGLWRVPRAAMGLWQSVALSAVLTPR